MLSVVKKEFHETSLVFNFNNKEHNVISQIQLNLHFHNSKCSHLIHSFSPQSMFFSLEMRNGYLHVFYDFGFSNGPVHLEDTLKKAQINDAKYHEVQITAVCLFCFVYT